MQIKKKRNKIKKEIKKKLKAMNKFLEGNWKNET